MSDSQESRPLAPTPKNQVAERAPDDAKPDKKLVARRVLLGAGAVATVGLSFWYCPVVDAFLEGKAVGGLTAVVVALFTGMVWWSTDRMQQVSVATLRQLEREFARESSSEPCPSPCHL
jgi:hypothetical protein